MTTGVAAAVLLSACVQPGPRAPAPTLPTVTDIAPDASTAAALAGWPGDRWWQAFGDPALDALVERALADQPALAVAAARLRQAGAAADAAGAGRLPKAQLSGDFIDQRFTKNGMIPPPLAGAVQWNNSVTLGASWEPDLWGGQRAALAAAIGQQRTAQAEQQQARLVLSAQVVQGWIQLDRLIGQRRLLLTQIDERERQVGLVRQRIAAGLDTQIEWRQLGAMNAQARVDVAQLDEAIGRTRHALAELGAMAPDAMATAVPRLATTGATLAIQALPADLLSRRPELRAQQWRIESTLQETDVVRAQFYPSVNLSAFVGLSSLGWSRLLQAGSQTYGAGPALRLPIFEGGRLKAALAARQAEVDAAAAQYRVLLHKAIHEVVDELDALREIERQQAAQQVALAEARAGYDLVMQRWRAQLGTQLQVLAAHQNVLLAERGELELRSRRLAAEAALARALGGGWQAQASAGPSTQARAQAQAHAVPTRNPRID